MTSFNDIPFLWTELQKEERPIVLYGIGNGADKIEQLCELYGIRISGIFANEGHTNRSYHGRPVWAYKEMLEHFCDPVILLAFGSEREEVIEKICEIAGRHTFYAPDLPVIDGEILTPDCLNRRQDEITAAESLFSDEYSRYVFSSLMESKLSGKISPIIDSASLKSEDWQLLRLGPDEDYLDIGAYRGDTIEDFICRTRGRYRAITALEPDLHNYQKLVEAVSDVPRIACHQVAAWNKNCRLTFHGKGGRHCGIVTDIPGRRTNIHEIDAVAVDTLSLSPTFVKLDVEGAESETLRGMAETICRCHPSMIVSVYHKPDDLFTIPVLINQICSGYHMYLRHHMALPVWDVQLYLTYSDRTA